MRQPRNLLASDLPQRRSSERVSGHQTSTRCTSHNKQHRYNRRSSFHEIPSMLFVDEINARWFVASGYVMENTKE
jgi:hypothetical protein